MTNYCKIGPITLENPHLTTEWQPEYTGNEKFRVKASHPQSLQLNGLVSKVNIDENGPRKRIAILNGWGVIPVDAAEAIVDNDRLRPRGYYVLTDYLASPRHGSPHVTGALELEKISDNLSDYLKMDYTTGIGDGTTLSTDYPATSTTVFSDTFTTLDTATAWYSAVSSGLTGSSFSASGGKLVAVGAASSAGVWGETWITNRTLFTRPFTIITPLEWVAAGTTYPHAWGIYLSDVRPVSSMWSGVNWLRLLIVPGTASTTFTIQSYVYGTWVTHYSGSLATGEKTPNFKVEVDESGYVTVSVDKSGGTSWTVIASNIDPNIDFTSGYYLSYLFGNQSATSKECRSASIDLTAPDTSVLNVVSLPVSTVVETADFTRASEDGNISCYANPTGPLPYSTTFANFYKGTVKAWNTNFTDTTARQITSNNMVLNPLKFYVTNGLIKLETTSTGIKLYYWNGSSYTELNTFVIGTIGLLKVIECTPTRFTFQANRTLWTLEAGKPFARVIHPSTAITYTRSSTGCYYHDATTLDSPAAGADVTMATQRYVTIWSKGSGTCASPNPVQNYRLLIIKQNTATIKSDSIPASNLTGVGWVNNTETAGSYKDAPSIAKEFLTIPMQSITLEDSI